MWVRSLKPKEEARLSTDRGYINQTLQGIWTSRVTGGEVTIPGPLQGEEDQEAATDECKLRLKNQRGRSSQDNAISGVQE